MSDSLIKLKKQKTFLFVIYFLLLTVSFSVVAFVAKDDIYKNKVSQNLSRLAYDSAYNNSQGESLLVDTLLSGERLSKIKSYDINLTCEPNKDYLINCKSESTLNGKSENFSFNYNYSKHKNTFLQITANSDNARYIVGSFEDKSGSFKPMTKIDSDTEVALLVGHFREKLESKL